MYNISLDKETKNNEKQEFKNGRISQNARMVVADIFYNLQQDNHFLMVFCAKNCSNPGGWISHNDPGTKIPATSTYLKDNLQKVHDIRYTSDFKPFLTRLVP